MDDWTPEMDEAFNEIEKKSNLGKQILKEINDDWRKHASEYERGFIDGMQKQMQSSVDKAVNAMGKREWVGLTDEEIEPIAETVAQPKQEQGEPVGWISNKDFEPIRIRIMQEAYELADNNDPEGYNAIKVMCGDVQKMLSPQRTWVGLTDEEISKLWLGTAPYFNDEDFARAIEAKLKEKNT